MYEFKFADIGEGIHEGVIHQWLVQVGDEVRDGQTLFLVETDKVTAEMPSPVDGKIHQINFQVGQTVHVGEVVVVINDGSQQAVAESTKTSVEERGSTSVVGEIEISSAVIPASDEVTLVQYESEKVKVLATPVARKMAKDLGVDIQTLKGTGPNGRVMKADIQKAYDNRQATPRGLEQPGITDQTIAATTQQAIADTTPVITQQPMAAGALEERVKMTMLRKTIAKNMVHSKFTIPHTAAMDEVDVTALVAYRAKVNEKLSAQNERLTYMPFILKAIAIALKAHPVLNASVDMEREEIIYKKFYGIGMATDTPDGLMVPVIKQADQLSVLALSHEIKRLAEGAKQRTLSMRDLEGGTFTITNYGAIGAMYGVPVIKHPEVAILGIGTIYKKPAVSAAGEIVIQDTLPLSISFDHRVVDGADAGRFLQTIKQLLADPDLLLLS